MQTSSPEAIRYFFAPPYNKGCSGKRTNEEHMAEQSSAPKKSRRQMLEDIVSRKPDEAFSRYGLALECMNDGDSAAADEHFRALTERNAGYIPGYQMYGQFLVRESRADEARRVLSSGIEAAART